MSYNGKQQGQSLQSLLKRRAHWRVLRRPALFEHSLVNQAVRRCGEQIDYGLLETDTTNPAGKAGGEFD